MKIRIIYSTKQNLYVVQKKRLLARWETFDHYFYTDSEGDIQNIKGFSTYKNAEEWVSDRYANEKLIDPKAEGKYITSE